MEEIAFSSLGRTGFLVAFIFFIWGASRVSSISSDKNRSYKLAFIFGTGYVMAAFGDEVFSPKIMEIVLIVGTIILFIMIALVGIIAYQGRKKIWQKIEPYFLYTLSVIFGLLTVYSFFGWVQQETTGRLIVFVSCLVLFFVTVVFLLVTDKFPRKKSN